MVYCWKIREITEEEKVAEEQALQQIKDKGYARPYLTDPRKLYQIGVNFSSETGTIEGFNYE